MPTLSRRLPLLAALALFLLAPTPSRAEDEGGGGGGDEANAREFPEQNFRWTLPAKWSFEEPSDDDKAAGFVAKAVRNVSQGVVVAAYVQVREAGGTSVAQNLATVAENKAKSLKSVESKQEDAAWSGAPESRRLRVIGMAENGSRIVWIVQGAVVAGKYHQLDLRCVNGAHHQIADEVDAAFAGYRFLEGAADVADAPAEGEEGAAKGNPRVLRFEKLGLTWTIPEKPAPPPPESAPVGPDGEPIPLPVKDSGWIREGNPNMELSGEGLVARAGMSWDGGIVLDLRLVLPKASDDVAPADVVQNEGNFDGWKQNFESTPIPKVDTESRVGNARAAFRTLSGKDKDGNPLWIRIYFASIKSRLFMVQVIAHRGAEHKDQAWMKAALDGLAWEDTKSGVRGPWAVPFRTRTEVRGKDEVYDQGKKVAFKSSAVSLTKPPAWGRIKFSASDQGRESWLFAGEAREGDALVFAGIQRFSAAELKKVTPPKDPETFVDDLEQDWKNAVDDPVTRPKSDKTNRKAGSFASGQGWEFLFTGTKEGQPWVQRGWVVVAKGSVFIVRVQFGGKEAEKLLNDDWNDLRKTIRFE